MAPTDQRTYEFIVVGSGLSGLLCAYLLAERGYSVCVLEQSVQFGGCLQIFSRDKALFDTGVHYIGELGEGEKLNRIFSYFGIMECLNVEQLDGDAFDIISFRDDPMEYPWAQGHDNFVRQLGRFFPKEVAALKEYSRVLKQISDNFYAGDFQQPDAQLINSEALRTNAEEFIASLTQNEKLRAVLAGNIPTYAGVRGKSPIHQHALIINSFLQSSWRCVDGGAQIAKHLTSAIRGMGGVLLRRQQVAEFCVEEGRVVKVITTEGDEFRARQFIAAMPPANVVKMLTGASLRKGYLNRIRKPEPTASFFGLYLKFKPEAFPYLKSNYYHYNHADVWNAVNYKTSDWPASWLFYPATAQGDGTFLSTASVLSYLRYEEVEPWASTRNSTANSSDRGKSYEAFKNKKALRLIDDMEKRFPGIRDAIDTYYTSTPLTYRDYLGAEKGAAYGSVKDYQQPHLSFLSPRSKVENLFFTGQHVHLHGIKGVTTTAILTVAAILNDHTLFSTILKGKDTLEGSIEDS